MKTLEELRDLATRWALDHISYHQAQSRVNLAGIGSGLAIAQRFEEESKRALDDALRELIADAEREEQSRAMFVARLENMDKSGDKWISVVAVLALLNDCDMLAARKG